MFWDYKGKADVQKIVERDNNASETLLLLKTDRFNELFSQGEH